MTDLPVLMAISLWRSPSRHNLTNTIYFTTTSSLTSYPNKCPLWYKTYSMDSYGPSPSRMHCCFPGVLPALLTSPVPWCGGHSRRRAARARAA